MNIIQTFYLNIFTSVLMIAQRITLARRLMLLTSHFLKTFAHNIHIIFSKLAMTAGSRVCHVVLLCLHMYVELRPILKS